MTLLFRPATISLIMAGLLTLVLAGCDAPDTAQPTTNQEPPIAEPVAVETDAVAGDAAHYHELRARWLELERAAAVKTESEVLSEPSVEIIEQQPVPPVLMAGTIPALGIIIDDVGHNLIRGRRLIALPAPVALAILPHTQSAQRLASEAGAAGKTVILHQPMENGASLPIGQGGLYVDMGRAELESTLQANLNSFIPIQGLNNHMGSRLTGEREAMDWVMQVLSARGLFFIDSRTSRDTKAAFAAEAHGVRHLSRDVFLDNERTPAAIDAAFQRGLELARKQGTALIIGHPYPETLDYLEQRLPGLEQAEGVVVVSVEDLLARKYRR